MSHSQQRSTDRRTRQDHRPMPPVLRGPSDVTDTAAREIRCRFEAVNPNQRQTWR